MPAVDDYLSTLEPDARGAFERVQALAMDVVPEAEQATSYGMAALRYRNKPLLGFRAASRHLSLFPFSPSVVDAVAARLGGFDVSKGTIRFSTSRPVPDAVLRDVVRLRREEIDKAVR
jgi:uncharacterized protein YdhG (YjbR/CyaY superfamily)